MRGRLSIKVISINAQSGSEQLLGVENHYLSDDNNGL
ncbi:unnamed protein product, partial [marine sediment metagenome]